MTLELLRNGSRTVLGSLAGIVRAKLKGKGAGTMANLFGRLQGARGEATRIGHTSITARLETWNGSVEVELEKDGTFTVRIGGKSSPRTVVAIGNVDTGKVVTKTCAYPNDREGAHDHGACMDAVEEQLASG